MSVRNIVRGYSFFAGDYKSVTFGGLEISIKMLRDAAPEIAELVAPEN